MFFLQCFLVFLFTFGSVSLAPLDQALPESQSWADLVEAEFPEGLDPAVSDPSQPASLASLRQEVEGEDFDEGRAFFPFFCHVQEVFEVRRCFWLKKQREFLRENVSCEQGLLLFFQAFSLASNLFFYCNCQDPALFNQAFALLDQVCFSAFSSPFVWCGICETLRQKPYFFWSALIFYCGSMKAAAVLLDWFRSRYQYFLVDLGLSSVLLFEQVFACCQRTLAILTNSCDRMNFGQKTLHYFLTRYNNPKPPDLMK